MFICTGKPKNSCDSLYHNICLTTVSGTELNPELCFLSPPSAFKDPCDYIGYMVNIR